MSHVLKLTDDELAYCRELGVKRHMAKHPSFREKSVVPTKQLYAGESHVLGILGEYAYHKVTGSKLDECIYQRGDAGYDFEDFDLVSCIGLGDYMYSEKKLVKFIQMLDNGQSLITANVTDNFVERFYLHILIQWPKMQYLSLDKYIRRLRSALGDQRRIKIIQTPHKIFNVAIVEPE